ncbi:hypothetical protein GCM10010300_72090 [Streptomyces olivaceoviridis]|nr:hypothetical protein GCM10010300_72090 [Streptomyces olivaceoviridis]
MRPAVPEYRRCIPAEVVPFGAVACVFGQLSAAFAADGAEQGADVVTHAASQVGAAEAVADAQEEVVGFTVPGSPRQGRPSRGEAALVTARTVLDVIRRRGPPRPSLPCQQPTTLPTLPLTRQDSETLLGY